MRKVRLIARLDIKGSNLIKGVHLEGLRVIGKPSDFAHRYYKQGADELIYIDSVASLYGRNHLGELVEDSVKDIFIPLTVGGGIRSVEDATSLLRSGADKVAINTAAVKNPNLISDISRKFGSQCMVISIQAKQVDEGKWEVFTDNGREKTGLDVVIWAKKAVELGAGEILLTSIDKEGTRKGFDVELVKSVTDVTSVPVIASGGMGMPEHMVDVIHHAQADAIAMADILHYGRSTFAELRKVALDSKIEVRKFEIT
jgi:cyclase